MKKKISPQLMYDQNGSVLGMWGVIFAPPPPPSEALCQTPDPRDRTQQPIVPLGGQSPSPEP